MKALAPWLLAAACLAPALPAAAVDRLRGMLHEGVGKPDAAPVRIMPSRSASRLP